MMAMSIAHGWLLPRGLVSIAAVFIICGRCQADPRDASEVSGSPPLQFRLQWTVVTDGHYRTVRFSPDSRHLAAIGSDGISVWDVKTGRERARLPVASGYDLGFTGASTQLVCVDTQLVLHIWNLGTGKHLERQTGHEEQVPAIAVMRARKSQVVATASYDGTVRVWDHKTHEPIKVIDVARGVRPRAVLYVASSHKWNRLATVDFEGIKLWTWPDCKLVAKSERVGMVAFAPDEPLLAVPSFDDGVVVLYDLKSLSPKRHLDVRPFRPMVIGYAPNGQLIAMAGIGNEGDTKPGPIVFYSSRVRKMRGQLDSHNRLTGWVLSFAFSDDGAWFAAAHGLGSVVSVWKVKRLGNGRDLPGKEARNKGRSDYTGPTKP